MKSVMTSLIATSLFCLAVLPVAAVAVPPGYTAPKDPVGSLGPWKARVRWVDVHVDARSGMVYTFRYLDIVGPTQQSCEQQLQSAANSPGVSVVQFCEPA